MEIVRAVLDNDLKVSDFLGRGSKSVGFFVVFWSDFLEEGLKVSEFLEEGLKVSDFFGAGSKSVGLFWKGSES